MGIFSWILFGLIAGALAKLLMPGRDPGGWLSTILIGIVGAIVGGFIGNFIGFGGVSGFDFRSLLVAIAGAMLLLWAFRVARRRRVPQ